MSGEKLPWFPFYASDWLADVRVRALSPAQRGVYMDLLAFHWNEGDLEDDPAGFATMLNADGADVSLVLDRFFSLTKRGRRRNRRMGRVRTEQRRRAKSLSDAGRRGAERRWGGDSQAIATAQRTHKQPEPESEPEPEDVRTSCTNCTEGKIVDDTGKILSCCECPTGRARARWIASDKEGEERSGVRRAADAKRERRGAGPRSLGKGIDQAVRDARPRKG